jgi:hypothetical protein
MVCFEPMMACGAPPMAMMRSAAPQMDMMMNVECCAAPIANYAMMEDEDCEEEDFAFDMAAPECAAAPLEVLGSAAPMAMA